MYGVNGLAFGAFQSKGALYYWFWGTTLELRRIVYNGADRAGYVRSKGATPTRVPLVPIFNACASPNRTHGPALAFPVVQPAVAVVPVRDGGNA